MEERLSELGISLTKVLTEVRYNRSFLYDDVMQLNKITKSLKKDFIQSQKDEQNQALILVNPNDQQFTVIQGEKVTVESDRPKHFSGVKSKSTNVVNTVKTYLDIDEFTRVGLRFLYGKEVQSRQKANELIEKRFFSRLEGKIPGGIINPNVGFTFQQDEYMVNVGIRTESSVSIEVFQGNAKHTHSDLVIFDIDIFRNGSIPTDSYNGFIKHGAEVSLRYLELLFNLIEGE